MMSAELFFKTIRCLIKTKKGLVKLGESMTNPVRIRADNGFVRRILSIDPILKTASFVYDVDESGKCIVVNKRKKIVKRKSIHRVWISEFALNCTIQSSIGKRLKKVLDRIAKELGDKETRLLFKLFDTASKFSKQQITSTNSKFFRMDLIDARSIIEQHDLRASKIIIHKDNINKLKSSFPKEIDITTHEHLFESGYYGELWGCEILVTNLIPKNVIYICAEHEFLGVLPIRQDPTVRVTLNPKKKTLRIFAEEIIGMGILNCKGVCKLTIKK